MAELLYRITFVDAIVSGPIDGKTVVTGQLVKSEPAVPVKRELCRAIMPGEPNPETEICYSDNALEPLTIIYRNKKIELTKTLYVLFRYVYDLYRTEGQSEFDFAEIAEVLTGDVCNKSKNAIEKVIRRITESLEKLHAPIVLTYEREILRLRAKGVPISKPNLA